MSYWHVDRRDWSGQRVAGENALLAPKLPGHPFVQVEADTIEEAVRKAKAKAGDDKPAHKPNELYAADVSFAAWNSMDKATRVKCVEDVGYPTGFAKQWAERDFTKLPADIKAGLLANGYFKQFVAGAATNFAAFSDLTKLASDLLKSGAAESDVRNALKAQGCTDENQQREVLAAARSYEAREGKTFAAMDAAKWNGLPPKTKDAELRAIGLRNAPEFAFADWDELDDEIQKALQTGGKVHGYSAGNSDTMKPGGKFAAASENDTAVWWNGKSKSEKVGKLRKLFPDEEDADHQEVAAQAWKDLPLPVRRALTELHVRSTYSANSDVMKPGGKFSAKFGGLNEPTARRVWGKLDVGMRGEVLDHAGVGNNYEDFEKMSHWDWDKFDRMQKDKLQRMLENMNLYSAGQTSLNGPGLRQDVVNAVLANPAKFIAEPDRKKASPAGDRWKDSMDKGILEAYDNAGGGEAGLKAVVASGLEPNVERAKSIVERLQKERHGGFAAKFTATLPTDDASKPEVKSFSTAAEAVNYLADNGFVNDRSRAVARVEATGKWSAPSGASVERFAAGEEHLPLLRKALKAAKAVNVNLWGPFDKALEFIKQVEPNEQKAKDALNWLNTVAGHAALR